ncbi:MAG: pyridoxal-phosphate dependent enzyme [Armatimonadetes bacterium]|nr:pyridoxal-phosphate dependent enzyme [Armatimonadota bacterium]
MADVWLRCSACGMEGDADLIHRCPSCGEPLDVCYDLAAVRRRVSPAQIASRPRGMWARHRELLPLPDGAPLDSLGEGSTPLVPAPRLGALLGVSHLYRKLESANSTGSFKDRQISVAVSKARAHGRSAFAITSSGNAAAAAAAYSSRRGARCFVWVGDTAPRPKVRPASRQVAHGTSGGRDAGASRGAAARESSASTRRRDG